MLEAPLPGLAITGDFREASCYLICYRVERKGMRVHISVLAQRGLCFTPPPRGVPSTLDRAAPPAVILWSVAR